MNVSSCNICGDFLFNGRHGGQVEIRCRAIRDPVADETINAALTNETINSVPVAETIIQPPTHAKHTMPTQNFANFKTGLPRNFSSQHFPPSPHFPSF